MLYVIIERYKTSAAPDVYRRARDSGRLLPEGLEYIDSWVDLNFTTCFQLMRTDDARLFDEWTSRWSDLVEFEIVPVRTSADASELMRATRRETTSSRAVTSDRRPADEAPPPTRG
jgi:hypothetical protein